MQGEVHAILEAYADGVFPMADARDDKDVFWVEPKMRGIIPLDKFNVPRTLKKFMQTCDYRVTINAAFTDVIAECAKVPRGDGQGTWINHQIESWFNILHDAGYAHSIEIWDRDNALIGGLYGLAQGGCFNGESMFSRAENASKIALVHLAQHIKERGFTVLDTQFINDHLKQFGCIEIPQADYLKQLELALGLHVEFN